MLRRDTENTDMNDGNSLAVQWLGLSTFTAVAWGSIPGQGTKILQAAQCCTPQFISIVLTNNIHYFHLFFLSILIILNLTVF